MAKISIISDLHLGFQRGSEREEDTFEAAERAFKKARELGSDLVLLAGDIFDSRFPRPEHWSRFMEMLSDFKDEKDIEVLATKNKEEVSEEAMEGTPVVAIHGTHERRGEGLTNPIQAMESAGFLTHLHCSSILLGIGDEKVGIHGMSGVPEKYSKEVLNKWEPGTFDGAYNIFMLHQDLDPYIFNPANPSLLGLEDLPGGFDCYVSGHIHWRERDELRGAPFVIPGSLVPTQLKRKESEIAKGFYLLDTKEEKLDFVEIDPPRKFFYEEIEIEDGSLEDIENRVEEKLDEIFSMEYEKNPLVRLKIKGKLPEGTNSNDLNLATVKKSYEESGMVTISKDLKEEEVEEKIEMLRDAREEELSVDEMGMQILRQQLEEMDVDIKPDTVFDDLVDDNVDEVMERLMNGEKENEEEGVDEGGELKKEGEGGEDGKVEEWWKG